MNQHEHPIWQLADAIQMDLRAATAKLTELRSQIAALKLEPRNVLKCSYCGIQFKGSLTLAEHLYNSHDGPLPDHWRRAEAIADEPSEAA